MTDTPTGSLTPEKIAQHYAAMLDSVAAINKTKPDHITDEQWTAKIERNKEHLRMMVEKDYWTDEDMTSVNAAIGS